MLAKLVCDNQEILTREYPLETLPLIIGRCPQAGIRLQDRWVSRRNSEILKIDGQLVVRDLGSSNGTLVNGVHVQQAPLRAGDRLTIGMSTFMVSEDQHRLEPSAGSSTMILPPVEIGVRREQSLSKPR